MNTKQAIDLYGYLHHLYLDANRLAVIGAGDPTHGVGKSGEAFGLGLAMTKLYTIFKDDPQFMYGALAIDEEGHELWAPELDSEELPEYRNDDVELDGLAGLMTQDPYKD
ncbi:hypothetical protein ACFQ5M_13600 [Agrilactobacillus yilanensis]|uniref:Uncharacterized protein n=1 Tax=Agrilactobacillus yilanensis TaxID=2485997 RepID=A0ABW4J9P7_9LACO|nr:hypothetical protein [Agrilactobacillus yilanensis]